MIYISYLRGSGVPSSRDIQTPDLQIIGYPVSQYLPISSSRVSLCLYMYHSSICTTHLPLHTVPAGPPAVASLHTRSDSTSYPDNLRGSDPRSISGSLGYGVPHTSWRSGITTWGRIVGIYLYLCSLRSILPFRRPPVGQYYTTRCAARLS